MCIQNFEFCENEHKGTYVITLNACTVKLCTTLWKYTRQAMYIQRLCNHSCSGRAVSVTYFEYVFVALGTQQCTCTILSSATSPALQYSSKSTHKRHHFRGEKSYWTKNVYFDFILQILSETFLILRRIQRHIITNVHRSSCKYQLFLSDFKETRFLSTDFRKLLKFHENPVRAELFHADRRTDGRTDTKKLIVAFRDYSNTPKNTSIWCMHWTTQHKICSLA